MQEQVVDTFVPNDVSVKGGLGLGVEQEDTPLEQNETSFLGGNSVVMLTGANACGKVILKPSYAEELLIVSRVSISSRSLI